LVVNRVSTVQYIFALTEIGERIMFDEQEQGTEQDYSTVKTILVVEDDVAIGEMIVQAVLLETPYEALHVPDGFQALQVVKSLKPSLFLLDYNLPHMNGIELYDQLHAMEELKDVPAILYTAQPSAKIDAKEREILWIGKPFDLAQMLQAIEDQLA
jgi:CheY-like chemotaxis protein